MLASPGTCGELVTPARIARPCTGDGLPSGRKVLKQKLIGAKVVDWYPEDLTRNDPYMLSIKAEKCVLEGLKYRLAMFLGVFSMPPGRGPCLCIELQAAGVGRQHGDCCASDESRQ